MPLMRISEYCRDYFAGRGPDRRTIIGMISRGEIHGEKKGGIWYVDPIRQPSPRPTAIDLNRNPRNMTREELHPLARKVLEKN